MLIQISQGGGAHLLPNFEETEEANFESESSYSKDFHERTLLSKMIKFLSAL